MTSLPLARAVLALGRRDPNRPAILDAAGTVTYGDLSRRVTRLTRALHAVAIGAGAHVGVLLGNRREHLEVLLAADLLRAVAIPLDPIWPEAEAVRFLGGLTLQAVVAEPRLPAFPAIRAAGEASGASFVLVDDSGGDPAYENLTGRGGGASLEDASPETLSGSAPGDLASRGSSSEDEESAATVALSAGSTGLPKAVTISRRAMRWRLLTQITDLGFGPGGTYLAAAPLFHGAARSYALSHLLLGGRVVLHPAFDPEAVLDAIEREQVTTAFFVPTMVVRLLAHPGCSPGRAASLRTVISSGAPLGFSVRSEIRTRLSPHLYEVYAAVESGAITILFPNEHELHGDTVGRPVWSSRVRIQGEEGPPAETGQPGRVACTGPALASGYLFAGRDDAKAFSDGWYQTGDIGFLDADGYLHLVGRANEMIVTGGKNVFPAEVERVLAAHPGVRECAVVGRPDPEWGDRITAFVVLRRSGAAEPHVLQTFCRQHLAGYKVPKEIRIVPDLPKTSVGKIDRRRLRTEASR